MIIVIAYTSGKESRLVIKVGLFIPCFMDTLYPKAAMAALTLLESLGVSVDYPQKQTCCGQPILNTGCTASIKDTAKHFIDTFHKYDYIVSPSGSCVSAVRNHFHHYIPNDDISKHVVTHTYELCEFLTDIIKVTSLNASFPYNVGFHQGCHGLRDLQLGSCSERNTQPFSKPLQLLNMVKDINLIHLDRTDECCGFGGTFAVDQEAISCSMGQDRVKDHQTNGAQVIVSTDSSCLMHLEGIIGKQKESLKTMHIAQVLIGESL